MAVKTRRLRVVQGAGEGKGGAGEERGVVGGRGAGVDVGVGVGAGRVDAVEDVERSRESRC